MAAWQLQTQCGLAPTLVLGSLLPDAAAATGIAISKVSLGDESAVVSFVAAWTMDSAVDITAVCQ